MYIDKLHKNCKEAPTTTITTTLTKHFSNTELWLIHEHQHRTTITMWCEWKIICILIVICYMHSARRDKKYKSKKAAVAVASSTKPKLFVLFFAITWSKWNNIAILAPSSIHFICINTHAQTLFQNYPPCPPACLHVCLPPCVLLLSMYISLLSSDYCFYAVLFMHVYIYYTDSLLFFMQLQCILIGHATYIITTPIHMLSDSFLNHPLNPQ